MAKQITCPLAISKSFLMIPKHISSKQQRLISRSSSVSYHEDMSSWSSPSINSVSSNEDLMNEIFLRLPVKSILRFRCLSKQWRSRLSDPQFIRQYALHKSKKPFIIFRLPSYCGINSLYLNTDNHNFDVTDFRYLLKDMDLEQYEEQCFTLVSSCNGLLLFEYTDANTFSNRLQNLFFVCNPSTKKYLKLERVPGYISQAKCIHASLAFDPCTSPFYKVVFFVINTYARRPSDFRISIYSSETESFKLLDFTFKTPSPDVFPGTFFFNGAICWYNVAVGTLYYFDINKESIDVFPKPPSNTTSGGIKYFGAHGGHLHLILNNRKELLVDVFELKEDYSGWVPKFRVDFEAIAVVFPEIIITDEGEELMEKNNCRIRCVFYKEKEPIIVISVRKQLLFYYLRDKSIKKIYGIPTWRDHKESDDYIRYQLCGAWTYPLHCNETLFKIE